MPYAAIHSEGGLIPGDILDQVAQESLPGQKAADFGLEKGHRLSEEISRAWSDAQDYWHIFDRRSADLPEGETGTTLTRERWVTRLFNDLLGYGLTFQAAGAVVDGRTYPISHRADASEESPPVHIEGIRVDLDRRPPAGHRRLSPQALVQDYLNRSEQQLWGVVTNGYRLRLLRQTPRTSRPAYLEFDLQSILEGSRFNEFALFYRLCHRTRLQRPGEDPHKCILEDCFQKSIEEGGRVRERLGKGVKDALEVLGTAFLRQQENVALAEGLQSGKLSAAEYHRELLRLVYRLLFLMVAEERHMIVPEVPEADRRQRLYDRYYSLARLRERAEDVMERSPFSDLWIGLCKTFQLFSDVPGENPLGIPPLNGDLFSYRAMPDLEGTRLPNHELLLAMRRLCLFREKGVQQRVNYADLNVEELGSVYESLLDFQPTIEQLPEGLAFELRTGTERKSTGSYYTRPELVAELVESALVPVLEDKVNAVQTREEKERAILSMKVCDSASGSGHFLLAAARRMGRELAKVRTGEEEPTPKEFHLAVRDVISHCIYGVDLNPLAVDLCKLSLWLEGHWTGKPLSFLDHHIKCGNSLIGVFDPEVLKQGIPDEAFTPVTDDDKKAASAIKKRNKKERESPTRRLPFERTPLGRMEDLAQQLSQLSEVVEDNPADVKRKAELYRRIYESPESHRTHRAANLWTAAFLSPLTRPDDPTIPTTESLQQFIESGTAYGPMIGQADSLAAKHRFFHWFLEFPEVFAGSGFDVVLGNPPWDLLQPEEVNFFNSHGAPEIAALTGARRKEAIEKLGETKPEVARNWHAYRRTIESSSMFIRCSGRFNLTAVGKLNTYSLFAELGRCLTRSPGRVGVIVQSGIATDESCKDFFADLGKHGELVSLFDFENRAKLFPDVDTRMKFCLLTLSSQAVKDSSFAFFCILPADLRDSQRRFSLTAEDLMLFNPNTRTCPTFRTRADAVLSKRIYRQVPVLVNERSGENPWRLEFKQGLFNMTSGSHLFSPTASDGMRPLYEGKMFDTFDHRAANIVVNPKNLYRQAQPEEVGIEAHKDSHFRVRPQHWVRDCDVEERLSDWPHRWLPVMKDITSATNERTSILAFIPRVGVGHNADILLPLGQPPRMTACLVANINCLVFDYVARQKIPGNHMSFFLVNQLPCLPPGEYSETDVALVCHHVLELVYTAWDIKPFADDIWRGSDESLRHHIRYRWEENKAATGGNDFNPPQWAENPEGGIPLAPFRWDEERRAHLRAELDAYYAHLYSLTRDELRYILDPQEVYGPDFPGETFRVLKEKEQKLHSEYRTRRLVLEAFDKLAESPRFHDEMPERSSVLQLRREGGGAVSF